MSEWISIKDQEPSINQSVLITNGKVMKFCECGCGRPAPIATRTHGSMGHVKGQPIKFIKGHKRRGPGLSETLAATRRRERRTLNKVQGLCHCGRVLDSPLHSTCMVCRKQVNTSHEVAKANKKCIRCGNHTEVTATCRSCLDKEKVRQKNTEVRQKAIKYRRTRRLNTSKGILWGLSKRPWPKDGCCELCGKIKSRMSYHHWDDLRPSMGIWVCYSCHDIAEGVEAGLDERYLQLTDKIEYLENLLDKPLGRV